ncbi:MAG: DUF1127 domain-containing protein [Mesorhizobium sp.]
MSTIDAVERSERSLQELPTARTLPGSFRHIASLLAWLIERRRTRMQLLELTDDQLKDIGLSRTDAYHEGNRSFFDRMPATGARSWLGQ